MHLLFWHCLEVGNRGSQHPRGGQCSHPAFGPGRSLRIQVGTPAKSLPVFQQNVIKTVEGIQFQLRQMSIPPGGRRCFTGKFTSSFSVTINTIPFSPWIPNLFAFPSTTVFPPLFSYILSHSCLSVTHRNKTVLW